MKSNAKRIVQCWSACLVILATGVAAAEGAPEATVRLDVNGVATELKVPGTEFGGSSVSYFSPISGKGSWTATVNYVADPDPTDGAQFSGYFELTNTSAAKIEVDFAFDVPLCPWVSQSCMIGGITSMKLTMNADGGVMACEEGDAVWSARVDASAAAQMYYGPFEMSGTGKSTATTYSSFGDPMPSMALVEGASTYGFRHAYTLTPGDKVRITTVSIFKSDPLNLVACVDAPPPPSEEEPAPIFAPGDLNHDGIIDASDLALLLERWETVDTEADLNTDGHVDSGDLGLLLACWSG